MKTYQNYMMVKSHIPDGRADVPKCDVCVGGASLDLCRQLKPMSPESEDYYCTGTIWIPDTDEARAEHTIRLLEAT